MELAWPCKLFGHVYCLTDYVVVFTWLMLCMRIKEFTVGNLVVHAHFTYIAGGQWGDGCQSVLINV